MSETEFEGTIELDVRDSIEDWDPYLAPKAAPGSPNILFVLFDDTGLGAWEPFGGDIVMPTLKRIADQGLIYTQWHTAALCSPTRGMLLTGRNHHLNGNASITEGANGFPGQHARTSDKCATIAQILQEEGYSTFWVGKNHNVPETDVATGSTKKQWPLAKGFDRFYGFIGGETSQWYPDLIVDNHPIELAEDHFPGFTELDEARGGYHLSKDLADKAIQMIKDQQATNPSKPWYMWFCPGANHAPHQAPRSAIKKYQGKFAKGYDEYRDRVWRNMMQKGILPGNTALTYINPLEGENPDISNPDDHVIPWHTIDDQSTKDLYCRMMEVYAAFSQYTDEQIGRIVDHLEATGQLENTMIIYAADNGASGEGSPTGSVNENKFFNGYPDDPTETAEYVESIGGLDALGGPDTYEHFPTGWAAATSTPFKMFKRYSQYAGGTCDPLVISWPKEITQKGIRHQYHHATDIVPTILDVCGIDFQNYSNYKGAAQYPLSGVSMRYTFAEANALEPTRKTHQYYAMLGTRAIWQNGWKAVARHAPLSGKSNFPNDVWELYHVDSDRSEYFNVADAPENSARLKSLKDLWDSEAALNNVLPLDDRSATEQLGIVRPTEEPARLTYRYYPGTAPVPESVAANIRGRSYTIEASVNITSESEGVIFAHGSRFGGHTLCMEPGGRLFYLYNFLGVQEYELFAQVVSAGQTHVIRVEFERDLLQPHDYECWGTTRLFVVSPFAAEEEGRPGAAAKKKDRETRLIPTSMKTRTQVGKFTLCGDGLCIGYDSADAIPKTRYKNSNPFRGLGSKIHYVDITPGPDPVPFNARVLAGAYAAD